jgi:1-acyl-sn-glycerol-3-phosphate acyltransferase
MATWYHRATWSLAKGLYSPSLLRGLRVDARGVDSLPEGPFLLLSDHANALDPYVLGSFAKRPIRFMANTGGVHPLKAVFAELVGAYGRRKGANDRGALRRTFELARAGDSIGIFPEGDRSWDGSASGLRPGVGKFIRRIGLPTVVARQKGNFLARPRWAAKPRRGPWSVEFLAFGEDELARMSDALAEAIIVAALGKNEIKDALREGRRFTCEASAEGIGRLLWRCPVCGKCDCLGGLANEIRCGRCGSRWALDANCAVRPINVPFYLPAAEIADLKDWHDWQVATLPELAAAADRGRPWMRSEGVVLSRREGRSARRVDKGTLCLSGSGAGAELVFEGESSRTVFEASAVRGFVDNFNAFSEFDHGSERWRVEFGGGNAAKWDIALRGSSDSHDPKEAA